MTQDKNLSPPTDALLARYHAANSAWDTSETHGPSEQVRTKILTYAAQLAQSSHPVVGTVGTINSVASRAIKQRVLGTFNTKNTSANDSQWKIRALATVAIFGITSLLLLQWDRGSPEEKELAFSTARPPVTAPVTGPAPAPVPEAQVATSAVTPVLPPATTADASVAAKRIATPRAADKAAPSTAKLATPKAAQAPAPTLEDAEVTKSTSTALPSPAMPELSKAESATMGAAALPAPAMRAAPAAKASSYSAARLKEAPNAALFAAIRNADATAVQQALAIGADKNAKSNGTPAITLCVQSGLFNLVQLLAGAGADVNAPDAQGITPLAHARARGLDAIANTLAGLGAH
jgi:cytoskeletal protein RodZ